MVAVAGEFDDVGTILADRFIEHIVNLLACVNIEIDVPHKLHAIVKVHVAVAQGL